VSPALLILVAALIALNAFFVMAEYALVRVRRTRLEIARDEGERGAELALRQVDDINSYISTCQVGITMTSIGIGALGEPTVSHLLEGPLGSPLSHGVAVAISAAIAYLLITSAHITLGEIVPKLYTIEHADRLARRLARPLEFSRVVFSPFSSVLVGISNRILRLLGVRPEDVADDEGGDTEELKIIIAQSLQGGHIDPGEAGMLSGVFELHEQEARQVMTPIPAVVTVDTSEGVESALRRCVETGHTRLLVTEDENPDRVRGIVHVNSLARALLTHGPDAPLEPLVKDAPIVPETKPLDDLLAELQRQRLTMAVVVDEYGRVVGVVTVEDILEEVVGEIEDETDPAGGAIRRLPNGDWFVRGHVAVTDLKDYGLELPVDSDAYNSIGGYVFNQLGRLPRRGDTISANGYSIRVESVRENRIEAVRIRERRRAVASSPSSSS
jgi:CBS domain containing-hemolysin-like protein